MSIENENKIENAETEVMQEAAEDAAIAENAEAVEAAVTETDEEIDTLPDMDKIADSIEEGIAELDDDDDSEKVEDEADGDYVEDTEEGPDDSAQSAPVLTGRIIHDSADSQLFALTPEQQMKADWQKVITGLNRQIVYERRVISVEPADNGLSCPRIVTLLYNFPVYISTRDFFDGSILPNKDFSKFSKEDRDNLEYSLATKLIDSYVLFTIVDAQYAYDKENKRTIYAIKGSRKEAVERKLDRNFFGNSNRLKVGDIVDARVLLTRKNGAVLSVGGKEVYTPSSEFAVSKWIDPVKDLPVGSVMQVLITELNVDKKKRNVDIKVSHKYIDEKFAKAMYDRIRLGTRVVGTVVRVNPEKNFALVNLDIGVRGVTRLYGLNSVVLKYGDRVSFSVARKRDDIMLCYGSCLPVNARMI